MSSRSPGPYKSRLFNFLNRHYINFNNRWEKSVRHLKIAGEWGVQVLLYPIYLLVQTGRMTAHRLKETVAQTQLRDLEAWAEPQQRSLTVDRPIEQVLKVIVPTSTLTEIVQQLNQNHLPIQGIASCVQTRALVLVTADNQVLNLLSEEQQQQLQQRISWELANYWYERRFSPNRYRPFLGLLPTFHGRDKVLLPVRRFWQLMRWEQSSPVAIALNLFQEADLAESDSPIPNSGLEVKEPDPFRMQILIRAAIDYFFGQRRGLFQVKNQPAQIKSNNPQLVASEEDLWLSWEDLFSHIARLQESFGKIEPSGDRPATSIAPPAKQTSLDRSPDWIEAEASPVGYVKHPLERILEWLDRTILWLEKGIAKIWLWWRSR